MGNLGVNSVSNIAICANQTIAATGILAGFGVHNPDTLYTIAGDGQNALLIIVDGNGQSVKIDQFHGTGFYDRGTAIAADDAGNLFIGGQVEYDISATGVGPYISNGGNSDFFICKYGSNCSATVGVNTINSLPGVTLYPNPATSSFTISAQGEMIKEIEITNIVGELIYKTNSTSQQTAIDLSRQPKGIYFVRITDNNKNVTNKKIVIQ
jgi:hypothetical protein